MFALKRFAVLTFLLTCAAHAENWPTWRGPASTGVSNETGLPVQWSDTDNLAWKSSFRGLGISSPIVFAGRVFVTSQLGSGVAREGPRLVQSGNAAEAGERALGGAPSGASRGDSSLTFLVTAFDQAEGRKLWEYELASEGPQASVHEKHNLASSSPVTDGQRVYAWFGTGQLVALDIDGKLVWETNIGQEHGSLDIQWGHGSSPVVYNDTVILLSYQPSGSWLIGLDSRTGNVRWKHDRGRGFLSYSTPFVVESQGSAEVIVNSSEGLTAHNPATGEVLWHIAETNRFPIPMPSHHDGVIYASRGYRSGPYMAIRPGGRGDVARSHVLWKVETGAPYISSLVHYDGLIYMMGDVGVATVVDAKTGERVWQERVGGVYTASPVAADGKVYFLSEDGETVVLAAGRTPRVLSRNRLTARQLASPAIAGGRLFIRSDDSLFAVGQ
jgi:outer membrane protein assembly factor BamB